MPATLTKLNTPWKFFIDATRWAENNPLVFDSEFSPGYFRQASLGLLCLLQSRDTPGDNLDYIIAMRDLIFHDQSSKGLTTSVSSGLGDDSCTAQGLFELLKKDNTEKRYQFFQHVFAYKPWEFDTHDLVDEEKITRRAEYMLSEINDSYLRFELARVSSISETARTCDVFSDQYRIALKEAKSDQEKIEAIVTYIQNLHQYHPFADGNGRTFIFFILNKLLHENNLAPTIIKSPGRFTGWSVKELAEEVKKGQQLFESICAPDGTNADVNQLLNQIRDSIKLSPEEERTVFLEEKAINEYAQAFQQSLVKNNLEEQVAILDHIPPFQKIQFLKQQLATCADANKIHLETAINNCRILSYYGLSNNPYLIQFAFTESKKFFTIAPLLEKCINLPFKNEPAWGDLVVHMLKSGQDQTALLEKAMKMAFILKDMKWFDHNLYIDMLKKHQFQSIDPNVPLYTNPNTLIEMSKTNKELMQKYFFSNPAVSTRIYSSIIRLSETFNPTPSTAVVEEWCQAVINNPKQVSDLCTCFSICLRDSNPRLKMLCIAHPQHGVGLRDAFKILGELVENQDVINALNSKPEHAVKLSQAFISLSKHGKLNADSIADCLAIIEEVPTSANIPQAFFSQSKTSTTAQKSASPSSPETSLSSQVIQFLTENGDTEPLFDIDEPAKIFHVLDDFLRDKIQRLNIVINATDYNPLVEFAFSDAIMSKSGYCRFSMPPPGFSCYNISVLIHKKPDESRELAKLFQQLGFAPQNLDSIYGMEGPKGQALTMNLKDENIIKQLVIIHNFLNSPEFQAINAKKKLDGNCSIQ